MLFAKDCVLAISGGSNSQYKVSKIKMRTGKISVPSDLDLDDLDLKTIVVTVNDIKYPVIVTHENGKVVFTADLECGEVI